MRQIPKTELSPDNGCIIDMKWKLGPLSYHASAAGKVVVQGVDRQPEPTRDGPHGERAEAERVDDVDGGFEDVVLGGL